MIRTVFSHPITAWWQTGTEDGSPVYSDPVHFYGRYENISEARISPSSGWTIEVTFRVITDYKLNDDSLGWPYRVVKGHVSGDPDGELIRNRIEVPSLNGHITLWEVQG